MSQSSLLPQLPKGFDLPGDRHLEITVGHSGDQVWQICQGTQSTAYLKISSHPRELQREAQV